MTPPGLVLFGESVLLHSLPAARAGRATCFGILRNFAKRKRKNKKRRKKKKKKWPMADLPPGETGPRWVHEELVGEASGNPSSQRTQSGSI